MNLLSNLFNHKAVEIIVEKWCMARSLP